MNEERKPRKLTPGEDTHLILLGAPYGLNFLRGKDFEDMLAFGRAVWAAALATPAPAQPGPLHVANERGEGEARGIEKAARWVDRRRDEYEDEHGTVDPETGSMEFGRGPSGQAKQDYVETLWEIAEGIRALSAAPKEKP